MARFRPTLHATISFLVLLTLPSSAVSQVEDGRVDGAVSVSGTADSAAVTATIGAFHEALRRGDSEAARSLLAPDLLVAESGSVETGEEYAGHHLTADMAFAAAVSRTVDPVRVTIEGDVAWAMSTVRTTGTYRDRTIDSAGAELVVLTREGERWLIRAIHWSSRTAR